MAASLAIQATMKKQGQRSGSGYDKNIGCYNKETKYFITFKKHCYKLVAYESRDDFKSKIGRAYEFMGLKYSRVAIDSNDVLRSR